MTAPRVWVETLPESHILCRTLRHHWQSAYVGYAEDAPVEIPETAMVHSRSVVRQVMCRQCETIREEFFSPWHDAWTQAERLRPYYRRYRYPSDYRWNGPDDAPQRWVYVAEFFQRHGINVGTP